MSRPGGNLLRMSVLSRYWCDEALSPHGIRIPVPQTRLSLTQ